MPRNLRGLFITTAFLAHNKSRMNTRKPSGDEEKFRGMSKAHDTWKRPLSITLKMIGGALSIPLIWFLIYGTDVLQLIVPSGFILFFGLMFYLYAVPRYCPRCGKEMTRERFIEERCTAEICKLCNVYSEKMRDED